MFASGAAALVAGVRSPWRRAIETRQSSPYTAFRGLIRPGFGSGVIYAIRVIYSRPCLGPGRPVTASAAVEAGLRGGKHRRARV